MTVNVIGPMPWQDVWQLDPSSASARGGQGEVRKVVRRADGLLGALKQLHENHLDVTERRYRAKQEADALHVLDGNGTPRLLDGNTEQWKDKGAPLYVVTEWVEGQTLAKRVSGKPVPLDTALPIAMKLAEVVGHCHRLGIQHRDLKPDNVMLRGDQDVVLVDFGMSWARPPSDETPEFETAHAQELGNRFLRLAENAPGHHAHDERTDLTCVVGLLLYMITGAQPRQLADAQVKMPHEFLRDRVPEATVNDPRWERIQRVFNIGFQQNLEHRFQSADELLARLKALDPPADDGLESLLEQEMQRFADTMASSRAQAMAGFQQAVRTVSSRFDRNMKELARRANVPVWVGGPSPIDDGTVMKANYSITRPGTDQPRSSCQHRAEVIEASFVGSFTLEDGGWQEYYRGAVGDSQTFAEAADAASTRVFISMLETLRKKVSE